MSYTVYIPGDAGAVALGADRVAAALQKEAEQRGIAVKLIRNGSRGLFWLEPLIEVVTDKGRLAYGSVQTQDVPGLFDANLTAANMFWRWA